MSEETWKVSDLVKALKGLPDDALLDCRLTGDGKKLIVVAAGHELDPVFQVKLDAIKPGNPFRPFGT